MSSSSVSVEQLFLFFVGAAVVAAASAAAGVGAAAATIFPTFQIGALVPKWRLICMPCTWQLLKGGSSRCCCSRWLMRVFRREQN